MQKMVFSKHLVGLPLAAAAKRLRAMGIEAVDLTVRPGGHVAPDRVAQELPEAARVLGGEGVKVGMITTEITDAGDARTLPILKTAAGLGIRFYKLGYFRYKGFGTLKAQREEVAARLRKLAALNREVGIHGGFHNHSADFFGAALGDVHHVLQDTDPKALGFYFDPAHATVEGGSHGWVMGMDLLADRITMLAVKDFRWIEGKRRYAGGRRSSVEWCPLADGNTDWPAVLRHLRQIGYNGPASFHSEYQGTHSFADLSVEGVLEQTARDLRVFRDWEGPTAS